MKRPVYLQNELDQVGTVEGMAGVFEAIASIRIAQAHDRVVSSTAFFHDLWHVYGQLRRNSKKRKTKQTLHKREALVAITSDSGLIGDIDEQIVAAMLAHPGRDQADIYLFGSHGARLLSREGIVPLKMFKLPQVDGDIDLREPADLLRRYGKATIYYQRYISLTRQEIDRIDLAARVDELAAGALSSGPMISNRAYIFEPSFEEVVSYMESVMLRIALEQVAVESRLAQYASRFNLMSAAKTKAGDLRTELRGELNRAKRNQADERTKEVVSALTAARRIK
jgi:ATP synthase F1 gamma subunit